MGIPVRHGAVTAGEGYQPGLSDYVIGAATREVAEDADLDGAEMLAEGAGLVDYLVDDMQALEITREVARRSVSRKDAPVDEGRSTSQAAVIARFLIKNRMRFTPRSGCWITG